MENNPHSPGPSQAEGTSWAPLSDGAFEDLVAGAYAELRHMAAGLLQGRNHGRTLQPTALVHEAYLRLRQSHPAWENRAHFFGAAARAMRQVLVEYARRRSAEKRGGGALRVTFHDLAVQAPEPHVDVLALDLALAALETVGKRFTRMMELRYFAGCTLEEIAELTGANPRAVKRDVAYARAWLREYMSSASPLSAN